VEHAQEVFHVSERCVCRALGQPRSTQRYCGKVSDEEEILTERIVTLASQYGRYGYRRITAMLQREGWRVNHKRVERIWRQEGLESTRETAKARQIVAERRFLPTAAPGISQSCLEL